MEGPEADGFNLAVLQAWLGCITTRGTGAGATANHLLEEQERGK
jgi:hypothetical protein